MLSFSCLLSERQLCVFRGVWFVFGQCHCCVLENALYLTFPFTTSSCLFYFSHVCSSFLFDLGDGLLLECLPIAKFLFCFCLFDLIWLFFFACGLVPMSWNCLCCFCWSSFLDIVIEVVFHLCVCYVCVSLICSILFKLCDLVLK